MCFQNTKVLRLEPAQRSRVRLFSTEPWGSGRHCRTNGKDPHSDESKATRTTLDLSLVVLKGNKKKKI